METSDQRSLGLLQRDWSLLEKVTRDFGRVWIGEGHIRECPARTHFLKMLLERTSRLEGPWVRPGVDVGPTCVGGNGQGTAGKTMHRPGERRMLKAFWKSTWGSPEVSQLWSLPLNMEMAEIETA